MRGCWEELGKGERIFGWRGWLDVWRYSKVCYAWFAAWEWRNCPRMKVRVWWMNQVASLLQAVDISSAFRKRGLFSQDGIVLFGEESREHGDVIGAEQRAR
jgi:hypothetical protein